MKETRVKRTKKEVRHVDTMMEFFGCSPSQLEDTDLIMKILVKAARLAGMKVVGKKTHKFKPIGFTGVVLLAQSHIAIHTYPQDEYAVVDILACNPQDLPSGCEYLERSILNSDVQSKTRVMKRYFQR